MKVYRIKQKWHLGGERFAIKDQDGRVAYQVEGSFFTIPKQFTIYDDQGRVVSHINKKTFSFLPTFRVQLVDGFEFQIKKEWTFLKPKYTISYLGLSVEGDIWDYHFNLFTSSRDLVASIHQELLHLTSTYEVTVHDEEYADVVISLAIAIDYVKAMESAD